MAPETHPQEPAARPPGKTRRTEGIRTRGRAARVVEDVLRATAEELGRVGYAALRVDDVATRSGVNKTTIYRRWPTKADLLAAAMERVAMKPVLPDTGSLEEDVLTMLLDTLAFASTPIGPGIVRMMQVERSHPDVEHVVRKVREHHRTSRTFVVQRAIERGELPSGTDPRVVGDLFFSPVILKVLRGEPVSESYARAIVRIVLTSVLTGAAVSAP